MINIDEIISKVEEISIPNEGYTFIKIENVFFGKSKEGFYTFGKEVENKSIFPITQETKFLNLYINGIYEIENNLEKNLSIITLKSADKKFLETFIRLSISIIPEITDKKFYDYFLSLKEIFANSIQKSETELQGFFAELYTIKFLFEKKSIDLSSYYQSQDRMKFDYSISETKKIEIKSTLKTERIHHFRQEQVNTLMYDIFVFSYLLRKDDQGLSLYDLIKYCKKYFSHNFAFIAYIEKFTHKTSDSELASLRFNTNYMDCNFRIINANGIPKVEQTSGNGVFNIEFDSNLDKIAETSLDAFEQWFIS